jgi:hypothetical protein
MGAARDYRPSTSRAANVEGCLWPYPKTCATMKVEELVDVLVFEDPRLTACEERSDER